MFIFDHAKDIWYIVLSICALTVTGFVTTFFYYLVLAAKDVREAAEAIKRQVDGIEEIFSSIFEKINFFLSLASIPQQAVKKIVSFVMSKITTAEPKAKTSSKKAKKRIKHDESVDFMAEEL